MCNWDLGKAERVVGGGFRIGNSCTPVADSCQCMAKPIQHCKVKNKIKREKKKVMAAITICSDFRAPKIKSDTVSTVSPSISHEVMGLDAMIFVY